MSSLASIATMWAADKIMTSHDAMIARYSHLPVFSATQIKMYKECRALYRFNYRDREQQNQHIASVLGSAIHKTIEHCLRHKSTYGSLMVFSEVFDELVEKYAAAGILKRIDKIQELKLLGMEIVTNINWQELTPRDEESIEMRFTLPYPNKKSPLVLITGVMDLITPEGIIIDHKSSSRMPSQKDLEYDPQFILYYWAYKELYKKKPKDVIWHHLRTRKFANTLVGQNFTDKLETVTAVVRDMLAEEEYPKKDRPDSFCFYVCDYKDRCWPRQ